MMTEPTRQGDARVYSELHDEAELRTELDRCRAELAAVRALHESCTERDAEHDREVDQAVAISEALDAYFNRSETVATGPKGLLKRRFQPNAATPAELADVRELRASSLFDGPWYLRTYPEVIATGMSPALHYLRRGAGEGKDPGPDFSTRHYVSRHPVVARRKANPLLNHLRTHR